MMKETQDNKNYALFYFLTDPTCDHTSYLSEFLAFIKSRKITGPCSFSYVGQDTNLLPELTLNDNILMNFSPNSLTTEKENQFEEFLKLKTNFYIKKLYDKLVEKNIRADQANPEMRKLAALIKCLTTDSEYIFLESPEKDLSENIRILFFKALSIHLVQKEINGFVQSHNSDLWKPICSYTVSRNKYFQFHLESIIVDKATKKTAA